MPQLMPLFWSLSVFMIMFILFVLCIFYYNKTLEYLMLCSIFAKKYNNLFTTYMW